MYLNWIYFWDLHVIIASSVFECPRSSSSMWLLFDLTVDVVHQLLSRVVPLTCPKVWVRHCNHVYITQLFLFKFGYDIAIMHIYCRSLPHNCLIFLWESHIYILDTRTLYLSWFMQLNFHTNWSLDLKYGMGMGRPCVYIYLDSIKD